MIIKWIVQVESAPGTRWWAGPDDLARMIQGKVEALAMKWSEGPVPSVTVVREEVRDDASEAMGVVRVHP